MNAETLNFLAVPATILLGLAGGAWVFRKAGFPLGKTVFGTLAATVAGLAGAGVITSVQARTGTQALPLAWLVPAAMAFILPRLPRWLD